jgi:hypothetical protein
MAPTATAEKEEVTHKTTAGSLAGAGAAATVTGITTAAVITKIANNGINFGKWFNKAKETAQNINAGENMGSLPALTASDATEFITNVDPTKALIDIDGTTGQIIAVTNNMQPNAATETAKNFGDNFKNKAGEVFDGLKGSFTGLKNDFNGIKDNRIKAAIIAAAALATLAVGKVTLDNLSRVDPKTDNVTHVSTGVKKGQTTELNV